MAALFRAAETVAVLLSAYELNRIIKVKNIYEGGPNEAVCGKFTCVDFRCMWRR